jgi:hypothetical protein
VRVADVGREEFEEAHAGALAGSSDERRHGSAIPGDGCRRCERRR